MKVIWQRVMDSDNKGTLLRAMIMISVILGLMLICSAKPVMAGEEKSEDSQVEGYESRIYGTVEKAPPGRIGNWTINRREVRVGKETRIIEKHGKAEVGAYVEVEGSNTDKTFFASKIEVKRSKVK